LNANDPRFVRDVEETVRTIEKTTAAEIVVVAAPRSGSYRDLAVIFGAIVGWGVLLALLFVPLVFQPFWVAVELPLVSAGAAWVAHRSPRLLRLLTTESRRKKHVEDAARLAFHEEAVHGTRGRTGVLVYLSLLEDRVVVLVDAGIEARIPGAAWHSLRWGRAADPARPGDLVQFLQGLRAAGRILAEYLPAAADDDNEISDAPRIRR